MPATEVTIGPFSGGLNTYSDASAVADNELVVCDNFEVDLDGSLRSRPPVVDTTIHMPLGATGDMRLLGYYTAPGGVQYLLGSNGSSGTYYLNGSTWTAITGTFAATAMAQFNGKAYLLAPFGSASPSGSWDPTGGFVADANMPKGDAIVAYKFRLWTANGKLATTNPTRLFFSNVLGAGTLWPATANFVDIGAGDGQAIVQLLVLYNSLLVFRNDSIWTFNFTSDPSAGVISVVVPGTGLEHKDAICTWNGFIYILYDDKAYEVVNNRATQINIKVPFKAENTSGIYQPYAVSIFNNRVMYSYYDQLYVFDLRTRSWCTWSSTVWHSLGTFYEHPSAASDSTVAYVNSSFSVPVGGTRNAFLLQVSDSFGTGTEQMTCTMLTKNYNYQAPAAFKRLYWWGIDALFRQNLTATLLPTVAHAAITWADMLTQTWDKLLTFTWDQPMSPPATPGTTVDATGQGAVRRLVKLAKSIRFRQIQFQIQATTDGSLNSAPVRVYSLVTYVLPKQQVVKQLS